MSDGPVIQTDDHKNEVKAYLDPQPTSWHPSHRRAKRTSRCWYRGCPITGVNKLMTMRGGETQTYRANRQVADLQILSAEDVKPRVNNATLFPWLHRYMLSPASQAMLVHLESRIGRTACSQTVPGSLNVVRDPVIDSSIILFRVCDVLVNLRGVEGLSRAVPSAHVNADGESIGEDLLGGLNINVSACGGRGRVEVWMVRGELATEGCVAHKLSKNAKTSKKTTTRTIHTPRNLASLLVTPADGREVGLVVHETTVESRLNVWVLGGDMDPATASRVLQILEPMQQEYKNLVYDKDNNNDTSTYIVMYLPGGRRAWSA